MAAAPAGAETRKLTILAASPVTVTPTTVARDYIVPEINKRLAASGKDFKIEWNESYGPNLAKFTEVLEACEEGIAHIAVLLRNFEESKLQLEQYPSFVPFGITDPLKMYAIDGKVRERVPEMDKAYEKYNVLLIGRANSSSPHIFTNFPIKTVDDLKGHKIGTSGAMGHVLRGTGAVIVTANMAQSYVDIKNGVYDGYTIGEGQAFPYRTYEVAQYFTKTYFGVTNIPAVIVNKDALGKLPDFVQQIVRDVGAGYGKAYHDLDERRLKENTEAMVKKGVKIHELSFEDRKRWAGMMPNIAKEWAADMDKQGLPGTRILTSYMDEVRASGEPVVRNWDKE
jgi:TRAP-type mannitol/chloroaromatic compound transport system substrate-binding protein